MALARITVLACVLAVGGCTDRGATDAVAALESFQRALFDRDESRVRTLLTRGSREVVPHLPLERLAGKQPFTCVRTELVNGRYQVTVHDPNEGGREATWVVVREDGQFRVDLLETTRFNHREIALPGPAQRLVPAALTPEQIEDARALEAAHRR